MKFVFQYTPESEAPAELAFYLPDHKAWCGAEIVSHTLHNLYTLRGAKVRNAVKWSGYIDDATRRFAGMEVVFASHHWPVWGNARALDYLKAQRDTYRYIHDQTLRLANEGLTSREIAEQLELPSTLRNRFANRDYYGTVRHNAKAVYQMYFGWYDGNPANLNPLPPVDAGEEICRCDGRCRGGAEAGRGGGRRGRLSLGRDAAQPPRVRRAVERAGEGPARLGLRPARLPGRVRTLARRVPDRSVRAEERRLR